MPILIIPRLCEIVNNAFTNNAIAVFQTLTKECITQSNLLDPLHIRIIHKVRINVEENRHIHRLARIQPLLLKTKTLDLTEIGRYLCGRHAVCGNAYDVSIALVHCGEESQRCFPRKDSDLALLWRELPWQDIGHVPFEGNSESARIGNWLQPLRRIFARGMSFDGLT